MGTFLEKFDAAIATVTQDRGKDYGHPADDFALVARLKKALPDYGDARIQHVAEMICVKLSRLGSNPRHLDSWVDIAGYARTAAMVIDRDVSVAEKLIAEHDLQPISRDIEPKTVMCLNTAGVCPSDCKRYVCEHDGRATGTFADVG